MHLAMKKDSAHREWRCKHGLPEDYETMVEVYEMVKVIEKIVGESLNEYSTLRILQLMKNQYC